MLKIEDDILYFCIPANPATGGNPPRAIKQRLGHGEGMAKILHGLAEKLDSTAKREVDSLCDSLNQSELDLEAKAAELLDERAVIKASRHVFESQRSKITKLQELLDQCDAKVNRLELPPPPDDPPKAFMTVDEAVEHLVNFPANEGDGKPNVAEVSKLVGRKVTAKERNAAFAEL